MVGRLVVEKIGGDLKRTNIASGADKEADPVARRPGNVQNTKIFCGSFSDCTPFFMTEGSILDPCNEIL
jgi:hypothetical protein